MDPRPVFRESAARGEGDKASYAMHQRASGPRPQKRPSTPVAVGTVMPARNVPSQSSAGPSRNGVRPPRRFALRRLASPLHQTLRPDKRIKAEPTTPKSAPRWTSSRLRTASTTNRATPAASRGAAQLFTASQVRPTGGRQLSHKSAALAAASDARVVRAVRSTAVSKLGGSLPSKRPAWDLRGRVEDLKWQMAEQQRRFAAAEATNAREAQDVREELRRFADQLIEAREQLDACKTELCVTKRDASPLRRRLDEAERELLRERQQREQAEAEARDRLAAARAEADQALSATQLKLHEWAAARQKREQSLKDKLRVTRAEALTLRGAVQRVTQRERRLLEAELDLRRLLDVIEELKVDVSASAPRGPPWLLHPAARAADATHPSPRTGTL